MITITITIQDQRGLVSILSGAVAKAATPKEIHTSDFLCEVFDIGLGIIASGAQATADLQGDEAIKLGPAIIEQMRNRMKGGVK